MCVSVCFPPSQSRVSPSTPASPASFGKCRPLLHLGNPGGAPDPRPFTARASSKRDVSPFQGEQNRGQEGLAAGEEEGATSLRAGPTFYPFSFRKRGTCRTDRPARCRVATELALSGRSYTSAWLSDLHLVMKSSWDLFLFFKLFYYSILKIKSRKNCSLNPGVLSSSLKDCQHFLSSLICSPLPQAN